MGAAFRICASVIGLSLATATASLGSGSALPSSEPALGAPGASPTACCKMCTKGKACGNACIAQDENCQQPPGCACDG
jgi:hypothetical protein